EKFLLGPEFVRVHCDQILKATTHYLEALYKALIEPLVKQILTTHVIIVPHGVLHYLPFHAFHDGSGYLIDRFEITYAPSASVLRYCLEKPDVTNVTPLIIGVGDTNAPQINAEVSALQNIFPEARILAGDRANRAAFFDAAQHAAFVHAATHATFR